VAKKKGSITNLPGKGVSAKLVDYLWSRPVAWCGTRSDGIAGRPTEPRLCKPF
jgi:hypothetical protein